MQAAHFFIGIVLFKRKRCAVTNRVCECWGGLQPYMPETKVSTRGFAKYFEVLVLRIRQRLHGRLALAGIVSRNHRTVNRAQPVRIASAASRAPREAW
ncbi:hypothetical protein PF007_g11481 [Phytophthora fragariae]|uniref:Uncharacterized protein n=1 Tax=Phytophthora fragariae TaxID=53985 RepID=A0A6A3S906_9STRA|nr:hypothetical protein PF007_g11481 [Phytophthora fragariae]KAE9226904.1 hypothetical protein PF004_g11516 [Phytophthora fragariae]